MGRLVLIGGGHAHLAVLRDARRFTERGHALVLVGPDDHHYYSGMGPGLLAGQYRPQEVRFNVRAMVEAAGGRFVRARAETLDPDGRTARLSTGEEIAFDVLSLGAGSDVSMALASSEGEPEARGGGFGTETGPADGAADGGRKQEDPGAGRAPADVTPVKPVAGLLWARQRLLGMAARGRGRVVVIGGGPAGMEIAACAWRAWRDAVPASGSGPGPAELPDGLDLVLAAGRRLLPHLPDRARRLARDSLARRGVLVLEGRRAIRVEDGRVWLDDGRALPCDLVFLATGVQAPRFLRGSGLPLAADGSVRVDAQLRCLTHPAIFGGGDCVHFEPRPLARIGVHAVLQGRVLRRNLLAALEGGRLARYAPSDDHLLIHNLGDDAGLLTRRLLGRWIVLDGWPAWRLKDWIDRRFMRRYQVSGETTEPV